MPMNVEELLKTPEEALRLMGKHGDLVREVGEFLEKNKGQAFEAGEIDIPDSTRKALKGDKALAFKLNTMARMKISVRKGYIAKRGSYFFYTEMDRAKLTMIVESFKKKKKK